MKFFYQLIFFSLFVTSATILHASDNSENTDFPSDKNPGTHHLHRVDETLSSAATNTQNPLATLPATNITKEGDAKKRSFWGNLTTSCRGVTNSLFSTGSTLCTWVKNASGVEEWKSYQAASTLFGLAKTLVPVDTTPCKEFIQKNRDWFIHALTDGATIGAIVKGSFANTSASLFEYAVAGPRWLFGFSAFAENQENMKKDRLRRGPNSQKIQTLRSWLHKIMIVHLTSDFADASIRGARDYVGIEPSDGIKSMVTNITFVTQVVDLVLAAYATHLDKLDAPYGKKEK